MYNKDSQDFFSFGKVIVNLIFILMLLTPTTLAQETIRISSNQNLSEIKAVYSVYGEIIDADIKATLNVDGSIYEEIEVRKSIDKELYNETVIVTVKLGDEDEYENIEIIDLSNPTIDFIRFGNLAQGACIGKYTFNEITKELRFCMKIPIENEVNYKIKVLVLSKFPKNVCGDNTIHNVVGFQFDPADYEFPFSLTMVGGEYVRLTDFDEECPIESWRYSLLGDGFKCSGMVPINKSGFFTLELAPIGIDVRLEQAEEDGERKKQEEKRRIRDNLIFPLIIALIPIIISLWISYKLGVKKGKKSKEEEEKGKRKKESK